jgi:hypothetical protein
VKTGANVLNTVRRSQSLSVSVCVCVYVCVCVCVCGWVCVCVLLGCVGMRCAVGKVLNLHTGDFEFKSIFLVNYV